MLNNELSNNWLKPYRLKLSQGCLMASSLNNLCGVVGYYFLKHI